jgi:outer membrane murein-binding lipoprotein Lpp
MTTQEGVPPDSLVARMIGELNANPEARTLLLRALLTDDFLLLPAKVDRLMELPAKVDHLQEDVSKLMELPAKVDRLQEEVRQVTTDLAPIRGAHARDAAQRAVRRIARIVNCRLQEQLNDDDLYDFTANNDTTGITPEDLKSFENADIVLRASHRDTGETHYIAIEASFTGREDDTRRALRNARYLTRFTGQPAHAVVAALQLTPEAETAVRQGDVTWYETERRHLEPS